MDRIGGGGRKLLDLEDFHIVQVLPPRQSPAGAETDLDNFVDAIKRRAELIRLNIRRLPVATSSHGCTYDPRAKLSHPERPARPGLAEDVQ